MSDVVDSGERAMAERTHRSAAAGVAALLACDGVLHVYWSTGRPWPARDAGSLSDAVLGVRAPFTPPVVLPLATLLFTAATVVYLRARFGRGHRWGGWLQAGTVTVAVGLLA